MVKDVQRVDVGRKWVYIIGLGVKMKSIIKLTLGFCLSLNLNAAELPMGSFGYLFPDANSLRHGGQLAFAPGMAAQLLWGKFSGTHEQNLMTSVSYGNGTLGLGVLAARYGMSLSSANESTDNFGATAGVAFDDVTLGARFGRTQDLFLTLPRTETFPELGPDFAHNLTGGFSWGAGLSTSIDGPQLRTVQLAAGLQQDTYSLESVVRLRDSLLSSYVEIGAFGSVPLGNWYVSGGYQFLGQNQEHQALARFGFTAGAFDLSAFVTMVLGDGQNPYHGGIARIRL